MLNNSPRVKGYFIDYCYSAIINDDDKKLPFPLLANKVKVTVDNLYDRIAKKIKLMQPNIILFHTGFIFRRYPETYYEVTKKLKMDFPDISFGYQERRDMQIDNSFFDKDEKIIQVQDLIFKEILMM
jgi:hypothetical protein